ncbi:putative myosin light chain kinase [Tritrichomonas foetus]|uniref:Myosin light chain kinase n=1 Tax=Tritrichomonas foetus TaxID=1144522 RepID=A0A1J4JEQ7_9EUKA|nr:putative myosin light chain kinase [Tritrichomonas foetus]|eukprot:OHS95925.1 putative myosin light chain kinase [Tritrichomonas foetus]
MKKYTCQNCLLLNLIHHHIQFLTYIKESVFFNIFFRMKPSRIIGDPVQFIDKEDTKKIRPLSEFKAKYEVIQNIEVGVTSTVDLVKSKENSNNYIAKTISRNFVGPPMSLWGFLQILSKFDHPNMVKIIDIFGDEKVLILINEYANDGNLLDKFKKLNGSEFSEKTASNFIREIVSFIDYLHTNKIAHNNLKPENILFQDGKLKIADFGYSKILKNEALVSSSAGSPEFLPPELLKNGEPSLESDLWNIGVLSFFLLTGRSPFGETDFKRYQGIVTGTIDFGEDFEENKISADAKDFIEKCLTVDIKARITAKGALNHPWISEESAGEKNWNPPVEKIVAFLEKRREAAIDPQARGTIVEKLRQGEKRRKKEASQNENTESEVKNDDENTPQEQ